MGSEESVPRRNQERQQPVTQNELDRILENQRMQYEQRCWEVLQANMASTSSPNNTQRQSSSRPAAIDLRQSNIPPSATPTCLAPPRPTPPNFPNRGSSIIGSANQNQHNLTQDNLQLRGAIARRDNLYPNLHATNPGVRGVTSNTPKTNRNNGNGNNNVNTDFVFINNNGNTERITPSAPNRDRSASSSRPNRSDDTSANCQTCNKSYYGSSIYQCEMGHSSCQQCRGRGLPCGSCRRRITDMRNYTLEAYVSELKSPCPNKSEGCNIYIKLANMETHIKECPFKVLDCPLSAIFGKCLWKGKINQISGHFNDMHAENSQIGVDREACLPNICTDNQIIHYTTIGNFNFLFCLKVSQADRKIYVLAQLLGTTISASKWNYEIQIYNKREPRRKYQYNDVCHSTWVPIDKIIKESKCGAIPLEYAMTFVNEGVITYKFFLKKEFDGNRNDGNKHFVRGNRRRN